MLRIQREPYPRFTLSTVCRVEIIRDALAVHFEKYLSNTEYKNIYIYSAKMIVLRSTATVNFVYNASLF